MKHKYYIDPEDEPWAVEETGSDPRERMRTWPIEGEGYRIYLHFGRSNPGSTRWYLISADTEWEDEWMKATEDMFR